MSAGFLETASVVFIDYGNNTPDSNGLVDNSWDIADTAIPPTLLPPILGFNLKHGVRGCMDLPVQVAEGQLNLSSPVATTITFSAPVPIFVVLWWSPTDFILGDANNTIAITLTSAMLSKVGACGVPGRILFEVASDVGCTFTWSWFQNVVVQSPSLSGSAFINGAQLSWTVVPGATSYILQRSLTSGSGYSNLVTTPSTQTQYLDTVVVANTTYFYQVLAVSGPNQSSPSNEVAVTPFGLVLDGNIANNPIFGLVAQLRWTPVSAAQSFIIGQSDFPGGPYGSPLNAVINPTNAQVRGIVANHTYYFVVYAVINGVVSAPSNELALSTVVIAPVLSGRGNVNAISLSWTAIGNATTYTLYRRLVSGGSFIPVFSGNALVFNDTTVTPGVAYLYQVTATVNSIESPPSNTLTLTALQLVLSGTGGVGTADLSWTSIAGATSYNLKRGTSSGGPYVIIKSANATSFHDTGLVLGTTYYYIVTAVVGGIESSPSNEVLIAQAQPLHFGSLLWDSPPDQLTFSGTQTHAFSNTNNNASFNANVQFNGAVAFHNTGHMSFTGASTPASLTVALLQFFEDNTNQITCEVEVSSAQNGVLLAVTIASPTSIGLPPGNSVFNFTVPAAVGDTLTVLYDGFVSATGGEVANVSYGLTLLPQ